MSLSSVADDERSESPPVRTKPPLYTGKMYEELAKMVDLAFLESLSACLMQFPGIVGTKFRFGGYRTRCGDDETHRGKMGFREFCREYSTTDTWNTYSMIFNWSEKDLLDALLASVVTEPDQAKGSMASPRGGGEDCGAIRSQRLQSFLRVSHLARSPSPESRDTPNLTTPNLRNSIIILVLLALLYTDSLGITLLARFAKNYGVALTQASLVHDVEFYKRFLPSLTTLCTQTIVEVLEPQVRALVNSMEVVKEDVLASYGEEGVKLDCQSCRR
eukprot:g17798.t1